MTSKMVRNEPSAYTKELMGLLDDEKRGFITIQTLRRAMEELKIEASQEVLERMVKLADFDGDLMVGERELEELVRVIGGNNVGRKV